MPKQSQLLIFRILIWYFFNNMLSAYLYNRKFCYSEYLLQNQVSNRV